MSDVTPTERLRTRSRELDFAAKSPLTSSVVRPSYERDAAPLAKAADALAAVEEALHGMMPVDPHVGDELRDSALDSLAVLAGAVERAERERNDWQGACALWKKHALAADARVEQLKVALRWIKDNAVAWHGLNNAGSGHVRALAVIATWCDNALAAVSSLAEHAETSTEPGERP